MKTSRLIMLMTILLTLFAFGANELKAQTVPVQLSLFNPLQTSSETTSIEGLRINIIYGRNVQLTGLDFGLVNHLSSGSSKGVQFGLVGIVEGNFTGWMDNSFNYTKGKMEGLQFGFFNYGGSVSGIQIGIVNYAESMHGLQIGFVNVIRKNGAFPIFPIVNWSL